MNREILFRGKAKANGVWVYGYFVEGIDYFNDPISIIYPINSRFDHRCVSDNYEGTTVDSKTIGQWTGRLDRNGKKVFEGDILKIYYPWEEEWDEVAGYIKWNDECANYLIYESLDNDTVIYNDFSCYMDPKNYEVIGNIYDNPKLLRKE